MKFSSLSTIQRGSRAIRALPKAWRVAVIVSSLTQLLTAASSQAGPPAGFTIPEITLSPDKRLGVLVPDEQQFEAGAKNQLVEIRTNRVLAVIVGEAGMENMNHGGVSPTRWSPDSSLLLWRVDGKWFPRALVLIQLSDGQVRWQLDLLKTAQQEILSRARQAAPKKYAAARKENAGNGSAYPDGFTVDLTTDGEEEEETSVSLPLRVHVTLTANPKGMEDFPANARLQGELQGEVGRDGKFKVLKFHLRP